jgi:hypothetical protein
LGQESDDIVSLPAPPPPNPAARRAGIDAALRKFDGIEDAPLGPARQRQGIFGWASTHRRATGGLVTAALIAVVGIPAMQIAIRNQPADIASERAEPAPVTADVEAVPDKEAIADAQPNTETVPPVPVARNEPVESPAEPPALAKEEKRLDFTDSEPAQKARAQAIAPMLSSPAAPAAAAPPPPPPPPPPPAPAPTASMAERETADAVAAESGNIVVTGQMARRRNMVSAAPATAITAEDADADFQEKLRSAFQSNSRPAILRLIAFPLKVDWGGDVRTYRTRTEVERDFNRIFSDDVRQAVLNGQASRRLTFAPQCARAPCAAGSVVRIRAVRP